MLLIQLSKTSRLQVDLSRLKVILVVTVPAFFLLASADYFGDATSRCGYDNLPCLLSAEGNGKHKSPSSGNSIEPMVQRWSRRVNFQSGTQLFAGPLALAQTRSIHPEQAILSFLPSSPSPELANTWQFLCRAALEPRAPSLVS
jgi:hypothetical protein